MESVNADALQRKSIVDQIMARLNDYPDALQNASSLLKTGSLSLLKKTLLDVIDIDKKTDKTERERTAREAVRKNAKLIRRRREQDRISEPEIH